MTHSGLLATYRERRLEARWRLAFTFSAIIATISSGTLIGATTSLFVDSKFQTYFNNVHDNLIYLLFFVSCMGSIAGFLGVCIITFKHYKMFYSMNILIGLVLLGKVITVCFVLVYRVKSLHKVEEQLGIRFRNYTDDQTLARHEVDTLQNTERCCGITSPIDWANTTLTQSWNPNDLPESCCVTMTTDCGANKTNAYSTLPYAIHQKGCWYKLKDWFDYRAYVIGIVALIALLGLVTMLFIARHWIRFSPLG